MRNYLFWCVVLDSVLFLIKAAVGGLLLGLFGAAGVTLFSAFSFWLAFS